MSSLRLPHMIHEDLPWTCVLTHLQAEVFQQVLLPTVAPLSALPLVELRRRYIAQADRSGLTGTYRSHYNNSNSVVGCLVFDNPSNRVSSCSACSRWALLDTASGHSYTMRLYRFALKKTRRLFACERRSSALPRNGRCQPHFQGEADTHQQLQQKNRVLYHLSWQSTKSIQLKQNAGVS